MFCSDELALSTQISQHAGRLQGTFLTKTSWNPISFCEAKLNHRHQQKRTFFVARSLKKKAKPLHSHSESYQCRKHGKGWLIHSGRSTCFWRLIRLVSFLIFTKRFQRTEMKGENAIRKGKSMKTSIIFYSCCEWFCCRESPTGLASSSSSCEYFVLSALFIKDSIALLVWASSIESHLQELLSLSRRIWVNITEIGWSLQNWLQSEFPQWIMKQNW